MSALWQPTLDAPLYLTTIHPVIDLFGEKLGYLVFAQNYTLNTSIASQDIDYTLTFSDPQTGIGALQIQVTSWNQFDLPLAQPAPFQTLSLNAHFSPDEYLGLIESIRSNLIIFAAVALLLGVALSFRGATSLTRPIHALIGASEQVRLGRFETRIKEHRKDEWGTLTQAFNGMTEGLETREKYRAVLNKVTDPSVAQLLTRGEIKLGGELRTATVLFCDIRGFTPLTQNMPPEAVIKMLNEHMSALTEIVQKHGGVVDKFVGDEIMALFGVPKSYDNDAVAAAKCAQEMLAKRAWLNDASDGHRIEMGIGISTGELVAGCMGSEDRLSYTVLGATVNLGARLCGKALAGTCIIDEATHQKINSTVQTRFYDHISVKGFTAPRPVFMLP